MRSWRACLVLVLLALGTHAQDAAMQRIEARVTIASGGSAYIDAGSDAGIEPGDRARAFPAAGAPVELVVQAVSRQSARCAFVGAPAEIEIGAPCEVLVPATRAAGTTGHPPWPQPLAAWKEDMPLLAPAESASPARRESLWSGRWYAAFDGIRDRAGDAQTYLLARTGLEATLDNASGHGDSLVLDAELFRRSNDDGNASDDTLSALRVERLSWRLGDSRTTPDRIEVGRFLHSELPQLGLVDGIELVHRTRSGDRFGASAGFFPAWNAELDTGDDTQAALFYRHLAGENDQLSLAGGVQKTWHRGQPDRDLVLGDLSWRPSERWWVASSLWLDYYDSGDDPKSAGFELTELHANTTWRPDDATGLGLALTHLRYPVLLRDELPPLTAATLSDGRVERLGLNGWRDLGRHTRVSGRLDWWQDQDDDGLGGEVRTSWRELVWEHGEIGAGLFTQDGKTTSVTGLRLTASRWSALGTWTLWCELARNDPGNGTDVLMQELLRGTWDVTLGRSWSLSLNATLQAGDEQDSTSVGFFLQRRF